MSIEQSRAEINRANSQHSTGPITEEGKKRSSLNALRHGLTSQNVLIPGEDPKIYDAHVAALYDEHNPQTQTESIQVQLLADLSWRLLRVATMESNLLDQNINYSTYDDQNSRVDAFDKLTRSLANLSLHSQRLSRQFDKTLLELRNLQKTRPRPSGAHPPTDALSRDGFVFTAAVGQAPRPVTGLPPAEETRAHEEVTSIHTSHDQYEPNPGAFTEVS